MNEEIPTIEELQQKSQDKLINLVIRLAKKNEELEKCIIEINNELDETIVNYEEQLKELREELAGEDL